MSPIPDEIVKEQAQRPAVGPWLPSPDYRPDPAHMVEPVLLLDEAGLHVVGNRDGSLTFSGTGTIGPGSRDRFLDSLTLWQAHVTTVFGARQSIRTLMEGDTDG